MFGRTYTDRLPGRAPAAGDAQAASDPQAAATSVAPVLPRIALAQARHALLACSPMAPVELPIAVAGGCVLARDAIAPRAQPPCATALADGWAVRAGQTVAATPYMPVAVTAAAVRAGEPLPAGCDAVLPSAALAVEDGQPMATQPAAPGDFVRRVGEDLIAGHPLLAAGSQLTPLTVAMAAGAGIATVWIRLPAVQILHLDTNEAARAAHFAGALLDARGATCRCAPLAAPLLEEDAYALTLVFGAAAIGSADAAAALLRADARWRPLGTPALRPGDTLVCGHLGQRPTLLLPARLDAVLAGLLLLAAPLVDHLAGVAPAPQRLRLPLARKIVSAVGASDLLLLTIDNDRWQPLGTPGDFDWPATLAAQAYAELPPESEGAAEGEPFDATLLSPGWSGGSARPIP